MKKAAVDSAPIPYLRSLYSRLKGRPRLLEMWRMLSNLGTASRPTGEPAPHPPFYAGGTRFSLQRAKFRTEANPTQAR